MTWYLWLAGVLLFLVAAGAIWYRVGNPKWVAGLATAFVGMAVNALLPVLLKRMPPKDEKRWRDATARGEEWDFARNRPREKR